MSATTPSLTAFSSSSVSTPSTMTTKLASESLTPTVDLDPSATPFIPSPSLAKKLGQSLLIYDASEDGSTKLSSVEDFSDDPTASFVQVKMQIADLTTHRPPQETTDASFLHELQRRLEEIKSDYFFDEQEAENAYREERSRADAAALRARLRGEDATATVITPSVKSVEPQPPAPVTREEKEQVTPDIFDEDSDDASGGILELLNEMPTTETTAQGVTVTVRDMALPKHYSGRTPKLLLQETVRKIDTFSVVSYRLVSGASRAKRAAVSVRWNGGRADEWTMEDIACHDAVQAEHYISTIALHALSFPPQEGFAASVTTTASNQTSFRLLPPVFRDLWDELEEKRKQHNDSINRGVWSRLKTILEPKLSLSVKVHNFHCVLQ